MKAAQMENINPNQNSEINKNKTIDIENARKKFSEKLTFEESIKRQHQLKFKEIFDFDEESYTTFEIKKTEEVLGKFNLLTNDKATYAENNDSNNLVKKTLLYPDRSIYIGQINIITKCRQGIGTFFSPYKDKYIGEFADNKYNGLGRIIYYDGSYYQGQFQNGKMHGFGKYKQEGYSYNGAWEEDLKNGIGEERFADGTVFKGLFQKDYKLGPGILTYQNGKQIEGFFDSKQYEQRLTGKFKISYLNGKQEISLGSLKDGVLNGINAFIWENKERYFGEYINGVQNGFGLFFYDSYVYLGTWVNGKQHGYGLVVEINQGKKSINEVGEWRFGMEINQFSEENERYSIIIKEINRKEIEIQNFFMKYFGFHNVYQLDYKALLNFKFSD